MEFTTIWPLRSEIPVSGNPSGLYLSASVPGAIYNRKTFPRKRHSVSEDINVKDAKLYVGNAISHDHFQYRASAADFDIRSWSYRAIAGRAIQGTANSAGSASMIRYNQQFHPTHTPCGECAAEPRR